LKDKTLFLIHSLLFINIQSMGLYIFYVM